MFSGKPSQSEQQPEQDSSMGSQQTGPHMFGQSGMSFGSSAPSQSVFGTSAAPAASMTFGFGQSSSVGPSPFSGTGSVGFGQQAPTTGSLGFGGSAFGSTPVFGQSTTTGFGAFSSGTGKPSPFGSFAKPEEAKPLMGAKVDTVVPAPSTPAQVNIDRVNRFAAQNALSNVREELKKERDKREEDYYKNYKPVSLLHAKSIVGTCTDMCPLYERYDREFSQELHPFEIVAGTENDAVPRVDHELAVKKYRRSAAGQDPEIFPEDIRPPAVLLKTMDYLIHQILKKPNLEYLEIYNFIRDRGRAIRKDFKVQNQMKGQECVSCLERLTRFLIHSDFVLSDLPESKYSWKQNRHQLIDTLTTLMEAYDEDSQNGIKYSNEPEFRSYYILLMLDDCTSIDKYQSWKPDIRRNEMVLDCIALHQLYQNRLFELLFRSLGKRKLKYLHLCIIHSIIGTLRFEAFKSIFNALSSRERQIKLDVIEKMLLFDNQQDVVDFCDTFGAQVILIEDAASVKYDAKEWPAAPKFAVHKSNFVLSKRPEGTVSEIVDGAAVMTSSSFAPTSSSFAFVKTPSIVMTPMEQRQPILMKQIEPVVDTKAEEEAALKQKDLEERLAKEKREQTIKETVPLVAEDILDEVLLKFLNDFAAKQLEDARFVKSISSQITADFVADVTKEILQYEFKQAKDLVIFRRQNTHDIGLDIMSETIREVCREDILEALADSFRHRALVRNTFSIWKKTHDRMKAKRMEEEEKQRRKVENLRSLPVIFGVSAVPKNNLVFEFKSLGLGEILKPKQERIPEVLESEVTNLLASYPSYLKLLLYTHSDEKSKKYATQLSIGKWIRTLFRKDNGSKISVTRSGIKSDSLFSVGGDRPVIVNNLTLQNYFGGSLEQQPNYLSSFPGTNAVIFHCLLSHDMSSEEVDKMKSSLMKVILSLPRNAHVMLSVLYWTSGSVFSEGDVKKLLCLDESEASGLIGRGHVIYLGDILKQSSSQSGRLKIVEFLKSLNQMIESKPELLDAFQGLCSELLPLFQRQVEKLYSGELTFHHASVTALDIFLQMHSLFRKAVREPKLEQLAWPSDEMSSEEDILWNSPDRMSQIAALMDSWLKKLKVKMEVRNGEELKSALSNILPSDHCSTFGDDEHAIMIWKEFSQRFYQHIKEDSHHKILCLNSTLKSLAVSWHYDLARATIAMKHIRKRGLDAESPYKSSPKRANMSFI